MKTTILDLPREPLLFDALREAIRRGAGGMDFPGATGASSGAAAVKDWWAYEERVEEKHARMAVPFIEKFFPLEKTRILDFGSGTGGLSVAMAARGARVTGVEPVGANHAAALLRARMYGLEASIDFLHHGDTRRLPFADGSFDAVIANSVLEYILNDRAAVLREMFRVTKKGGHLCITDTSNGLYPVEIHSKRFLVNWLPASRAARLGSERGLSYWEIRRALAGEHYDVCNLGSGDDEVAAFFMRHGQGGGVHRLLYIFFRTLQRVFCRPFALPVAAFLPWLNLVIRKR